MKREKRLSVRITTRITQDELKYLKAIAKEYNANRSEALRILIRSEYEVITGKVSSNN